MDTANLIPKDTRLVLNVEMYEARYGSGSDEFKVVGKFVALDRNKELCYLTSPEFDGLRLATSCDADYAKHGFTYWKTDYRDVNVDLSNCDRIAKTLHTIQRFIEKARELDGESTSFGQYAMRVARALGAKEMRLDRTQFVTNGAKRTFFERYYVVSLLEGSQIINSKMNEWIESKTQAGGA